MNDSLEAADAVLRASGLVARGRWDEAAVLLQDASDEVGDRLIRTEPGRYLGVRRHVNDLICEWPAAGLEAYRARYDAMLQSELNRLAPVEERSLTTLLGLFERYFCTATAARLADTLGQLALESGDLSLARYVYQRVLDSHPDQEQYDLSYRATVAIVRTMSADKIVEIGDGLANVRLQWMGQERALPDILGEVKSGFRAPAPAGGASDWPVFGGNATRTAQLSAPLDDIGLLWRFDARIDDLSRGAVEDVDEASERYESRARLLTIEPIVADGLIYLQIGRELFALHRHTGATAWHFRAEESAVSATVEQDDEPGGWHAATFSDGFLYAALPAESAPQYTYDAARRPAELVCLHAGTGRTVWRTSAEQMAESFSELSFDSSPLLRQDKLLVVARRRRSFGFEDCYLYRFNARNGAFEHRTHLGGGSTGSYGSRQPTRTAAALVGDTVFVASNLGTVAAVSVHDGSIRWLRAYGRDRFRDESRIGYTTRDARPWHSNPVVAEGGRVVALPSDSLRLLVLDVATGVILQAIPRTQLGEADTLVGIDGSQVHTVGAEVVCYNLTSETARWARPIPEESELFGRPVRAGDQLLVPTRRHLLAFGVTSGGMRELDWNIESEGGNLVPLSDQLLVAGVGCVSAYVRRSEIWTALRDRMSASPADPQPAMELAEIALSNGEYREAVSALREAVSRADTLRELPEAALRRRLFDDAMMFAERLWQRGLLTPEELDWLFSFASRFAPDTAANLLYRIRFAALYEKLSQPERAVRLFQQVLRDASLVDLPVHPSAKESPTASAYVQSRIAALITEHGRKVYAEFDEEATRLLAAGRIDEDEVALARLTRVYPNSHAAPDAFIARAELLARRDRPAEAAAVLAQVYHRYPERADRPALLRQIADTLEQGGLRKRAYLWLTKASREHPSYRFMHDGRTINFLTYREQLADVISRVEPRLPRLTLPLTLQFTIAWDEQSQLLTPQFASEPESDWSRFYVKTTEGIRAFDSRTARALWAEPAASRTRTQLVVATSDQAVFANLYEVFGVDVNSGERRWSHGTVPDHLDRVDGDWEDGTVIRQFARFENLLAFLRDNGEITLIDTASGRVRWSAVQQPRPMGPIALSDRWLVYPHLQLDADERIVLCVVSTETGAWVHTIPTRAERGPEELLITLDGQIVLASSRAVSAYDSQSGQMRWRTGLDGFLRRSSLRVDIDAAYLSSDGRTIQKLSLDDGRVLWESEPLARRGDEDLTVDLRDASLIVSTTSSIGAIDMVTGLLLWRGTSPESARFAARRLTRSYVMALDVPNDAENPSAAAYFYDHRNASGLLARDGGALSLGPVADIRAVLVVDDALLIQTGSTIHGWAHDAP